MNLKISHNFDRKRWMYRYVIEDRDDLSGNPVQAFTNDTEIGDYLDTPDRFDYESDAEYQAALTHHNNAVCKATALFKTAAERKAEGIIQ